MKKLLRVHADALAEFAAQAVYYESKSSGLGEKFTNEVEAATQIARKFPEMGAAFKYKTCRISKRELAVATAPTNAIGIPENSTGDPSADQEI